MAGCVLGQDLRQKGVRSARRKSWNVLAVELGVYRDEQGGDVRVDQADTSITQLSQRELGSREKIADARGGMEPGVIPPMSA